MRLDRSVFGNENAENDHLLNACYVAPPGAKSGKPILVGRWGTGKTGYLLHTNQELEKALVSKNSRLSRIWYLDKNAIDTHSLF